MTNSLATAVDLNLPFLQPWAFCNPNSSIERAISTLALQLLSATPFFFLCFKRSWFVSLLLTLYSLSLVSSPGTSSF